MEEDQLEEKIETKLEISEEEKGPMIVADVIQENDLGNRDFGKDVPDN